MSGPASGQGLLFFCGDKIADQIAIIFSFRVGHGFSPEARRRSGRGPG
jgi:hypothetical protein